MISSVIHRTSDISEITKVLHNLDYSAIKYHSVMVRFPPYIKIFQTLLGSTRNLENSIHRLIPEQVLR